MIKLIMGTFLFLIFSPSIFSQEISTPDNNTSTSLKVKKEDGKPFRVLIIDDSMFVRKQMSQILNSGGFKVVATASNGEEGLVKYKELYPNIDLITMDITMQKMDGVKTLEKIIKFNKDAKVIVVSTLGNQSLLVKKALAIGAKNYIVKPLNREDVYERIYMILQ